MTEKNKKKSNSALLLKGVHEFALMRVDIA
jgi:hypothetical protein